MIRQIQGDANEHVDTVGFCLIDVKLRLMTLCLWSKTQLEDDTGAFEIYKSDY